MLATLGIAQTTQIATFPYLQSRGLSPSVKVGSKLFFSAYTAAEGRELWCTDGTAGGTYLVKDIMAGTGSGIGDYFELTAYNHNGVLYFRGNDVANGIELWRSDGTAAGTYLVKDISPGNSTSSVGYFASIGNVLYFTAFSGSQLWRSDGTVAGAWHNDLDKYGQRHGVD